MRNRPPGTRRSLSAWIFACLLLAAAVASAQEYQQALPGYQFQFPRDDFNHENYQTEWWYYTGNLRAPDGHRFGFELTFFRQGVSRAPGSDPWYVHDVWMAHLALSDIGAGRFHHQERLNRAGPGLAGVDAATGTIWNGNWQATITPRQEHLRGIGRDFAFSLKLLPAKPPVIQGQNGVSQKAAGLGHASHYYSRTRLLTSGSIEVAGRSYQVEGTSWMDHEFFTGSMAPNESGWDWLSVQFDDGAELMLYRMRRKDGSIDPYSSGSYVDAQGRSRFLSARDFVMTPAGDTWTSPATKAAYPLRWHVSVPLLHLAFEVTTPLRAQEMTGRFGPSYWEGAIDIAGTHDGSPTHGVGYLEMTGYAEPGRAVVPR
ncbi:MAG: lipocalin-like domain-containing protein [Acidobacteriota bacterium]